MASFHSYTYAQSVPEQKMVNLTEPPSSPSVLLSVVLWNTSLVSWGHLPGWVPSQPPAHPPSPFTGREE